MKFPQLLLPLTANLPLHHQSGKDQESLVQRTLLDQKQRGPAHGGLTEALPPVESGVRRTCRCVNPGRWSD